MAVVNDLGQQSADSPPPAEDFGASRPRTSPRAVGAGRHAAEQGCDRRRPGAAAARRFLPSGPPERHTTRSWTSTAARPADAVTVAAELDRRGLLRRIGGAPYLHTLISTVPTAANAGYYAGIVAEKALLRRLVEAGTWVVQVRLCRGRGCRCQRDRRPRPGGDLRRHRAAHGRGLRAAGGTAAADDGRDRRHRLPGRISRGVPTGFTELDELTNGLHPGQMIVIAARPGMGKALKLDTPLPTPHRWTTMGEVAVGDWFARCRRPADEGGRSDRGDGRAAVLRGRVLRRIGDCRRCRASVADAARHRNDRAIEGRHRCCRRRWRPEAHRRGLYTVARVRHRRYPGDRQRPRPLRRGRQRGPSLSRRLGDDPTHNSTLGLDFLRSCSIKNRLSSVVFSWR